MEIKYLDDYVDYMHEIYPEMERKAVQEMMEDSFFLVRKVLSKPRNIRVHKKGSPLFGDSFKGTFKIRTVYSTFQGARVRDKLDRLKKTINKKKNEQDSDK